MNGRSIHPDDEGLEARIEDARMIFATATSRRDRERWWSELKRLIAQRSPRQIANMERERGITPVALQRR